MQKVFRSSACTTIFSIAAALTAADPSHLVAQATKTIDSVKISRDALAKMTPRSGQHLAAAALKNHSGPKLGAASKFASVPGIDSLTNWTGQFTAPGFDSNNNPQSVWPFEMVGNAPESNQTAVLRAPIVPVTVKLLDQDGKVATNNGFPLIAKVTPTIVNAVVKSPLFQNWSYTSGVGQINDQLMRAQFWNRIGHGDDSEGGGNWHTLLAPRVQTTRTMSIPFGSWAFTPNDNGSCCLAVYLDENAFVSRFFPPTFPVDNTTVIGAAELAGDVTTKDLSTFLFNNVYLYSGDVSNCCILGFHTYDFEPGIPANGNLERRYVLNYSSWITNGLFSHGFEDITATSHEIAETFDDPFVDNATPWWLSFDKFSGASLCQNNLETGDVVEILRYNGVFPISMNGRTYHPQNEAMFPWFAFQSPSKANLHAYSFPDETTLTALSPSPLHAGCAP
jgi:hypothetical protein